MNFAIKEQQTFMEGSEDEHVISGDKKKYVIAEVTAADVCEFTVDAGDNFIILKGNDFTGSLSLEIE